MIGSKAVLEVAMVDTNFQLDLVAGNFSQAIAHTFDGNRSIDETNECCRHSDKIGITPI